MCDKDRTHVVFLQAVKNSTQIRAKQLDVRFRNGIHDDFVFANGAPDVRAEAQVFSPLRHSIYGLEQLVYYAGMEPLRLPNPIQSVRLTNGRIVDVAEETGIENRDARRESIEGAIDTVRKRTQRLTCISNIYDLDMEIGLARVNYALKLPGLLHAKRLEHTEGFRRADENYFRGVRMDVGTAIAQFVELPLSKTAIGSADDAVIIVGQHGRHGVVAKERSTLSDVIVHTGTDFPHGEEQNTTEEIAKESALSCE